MNSPSNKPLAQWIHALGATFLIAAVSSSAAAPRPASEPANSLRRLGDGFNLKAGQQTSTTERRSQTQTSAVGTTAGGVNVTVGAAQDINLKGSSVIGEQNVTLAAGNNINIEAAQNTSTQSNFYETKESGLLSGGGPLSISIGNRQQSTDHKDQSTTAAASTIGAINGNVNITAGNTYQQTGSDLLSPKGDITVLAKDIKITEARETSQSATETKFKQSGLTISISNPLLSAAQGVQSMAQAAGNTNDTRMKALAAASSALTGYNTWSSLLNKDTGKMDPEKAMDITINVSLGTSKSQSNTTAQADTAKASSLSAGGNVNVTATGAGKESNLAVQGSSVTAGNSAALTADGQVSLLAATNTASQLSTNSNSSTSVGVSYSVMTQSIGFNASASKGQGKSDGQDTSYTNTQIAAGNIATIKSGADTNIKGAVVTANTIKADVGQQFGGSLSIESLQDTSSYTSKQTSSGGSISVGGGAVTGGSVSASKSNIDSTFTSVNQQSGFKAGDGGFQVTVAGNTDLKGGVITSTQKAVDDKANTFTTGGQLTTTDVQNVASFKGEAVGISVDVGKQDGKYGVAGAGIGAGSDKGSAASTSAAGITGIAGNKDARTGDKDTGLQKIFDQNKVQKKIDAEVAITQAFTKQAPTAAATFMDNQIKAIEVQLEDTTLSPAKRAELQQDIKDRSEGGIVRVLVQTAVGALGGGAGGALGAGISAKAAPLLTEFQDSIAQKLEASGMSPAAAKLVASGITGLTVAGVGAVVGGGQGATYGAAVDFNNRQLHPVEQQRIQVMAKNDSAKEQRLTDAACAIVKCSAEFATGTQEYVADRNSEIRGQGNTFELKQLADINSVNPELFGKNTWQDNALDSGQKLVNTAAVTGGKAIDFTAGVFKGGINTIVQSGAVGLDVVQLAGSGVYSATSGQPTSVTPLSDVGKTIVKDGLLETVASIPGNTARSVSDAGRSAGQGKFEPVGELVGSLAVPAVIGKVTGVVMREAAVADNVGTTGVGKVALESPPSVTSGANGGTAAVPKIDSAPPPNSYPVYTHGAGAAEGPLPPGYTTVSRWVSPEEASLWVQNQGTAIPAAIPRNGTPQLYVTQAGAPYPPGANGTVRIDFAVPDTMLKTGNAPNNFMILQPSSSTPIYNVNIHVPNGVTLPKAR